MDQAALIAALESGSLDPREFTHRNHVRAGWHYLRALPMRDAAHRFSDVLQAYVRGIGAEHKFHLTLTLAFMHLIHQRMRGDESWDSFADRNPELFSDAKDLIAQHYHPQTIGRGRQQFVAPDLAELPLTAPRAAC